MIAKTIPAPGGSSPAPGSTPTSDADLVYRTSTWQRSLYDDATYANERLRHLEEDGSEKIASWSRFQRETFARLYGNPPALDEPAAGADWATKAHSTLPDLPEWQRLAQYTQGDEFAAEVAVQTIARHVLDAMPSDKRQQQDPQAQQERADALKDLAASFAEGSDAAATLAEQAGAADALAAQAAAEGEALADALDDASLRVALREACDSAQDAVDEQAQALAALGCGGGPGQAQRGGDAGSKRRAADLLMNSSKLKEIARKAGRLRQLANNAQKAEAKNARERLLGINRGDDLSRLLPTEIHKLADPDRRGHFLKGYVERTLLQYRLGGKLPQGKGPIVFCIDESGSMAGDREVWAKAVCLAMLEVAARQKRVCALVHFDRSVSRVDVFRPGQYGTAEVLDAMMHFSGGGTNFDAPLRAAVELIEAEGDLRKADVVLVTDGAASADEGWWAEAKEAKDIRCYGIAIGHSVPGIMGRLCDEAHSVRDLADDSSDEQAVREALFTI